MKSITRYTTIFLLIIVASSSFSGCAALIMSRTQPVMIVNAPKATLVTPKGERIKLTRQNQSVYLPRSRNSTIAIECSNMNLTYRKFHTTPNIAFLLGNLFLAFPFGHFIDLFSDKAWDYVSPVNLSGICPQPKSSAMTSKFPSSKNAGLSLKSLISKPCRPQKNLPTSTMFIEEIDKFDESRTITSKILDSGNSLSTSFSLSNFNSSFMNFLILTSTAGEMVCHDETSELIIVFNSGIKKKYTAIGGSDCDHPRMATEFSILLHQFPSEPISMMRLQFKDNQITQKTFVFEKMKGSKLARHIEIAVKEAKKIKTCKMQIKKVITTQ